MLKIEVYLLLYLHLYAFVGENFLLQVTTVELDGSGGKVGYIVGIDVLILILQGTLLWHEERFGELSLFIDVGKVEACV